MNKYTNLIHFLVLIIFGVGLEMILSKIYFRRKGIKQKHQVVHFSFFRYLFILFLPLLATLLMSYVVGFSVIKSFVVFAAMGTILEYCIGYSYYIVVGQKLWTYHRFSIQGYTSLLSIPLWGLCGVLFYLMASVIS